MAEATQRDVRYDSFLTNVSIGYKNAVYIADQMCPIVPSGTRSGLIPKYDQSHWFRNTAAERAPGTRSRRTGFTVSQDNFYCLRFSQGFELPDEFRDDTMSPYDMDRDGALFATDKVQLVREIKFATEKFTSGVWGTDLDGSGADFVQWDLYGTSNPLVDITNWQDIIEGKTGLAGNQLTLGKQVWSSVKWHPDVIDTIKHTQTAMMSTDLFARLVEVDRLLIGRSIYTTDPEGTAEASVTYQRVWGKHALLQYVPTSPTLMNPASCYTFTWTRVPNSIQYIKRMRDDEKEIDIFEANTYFDQRVTSANSALFAENAIQ